METNINDGQSSFAGMMYRALVVDDEDPRDIGRIKVRIPGVYGEDVEHDSLPWAIPATGLYRSGGENLDSDKSIDIGIEKLKTSFNSTGTGGLFTVPNRGNHVWVWFDNGNHMHPVYFAMAPGENDWLRQKEFVKDKLNEKIEQIKALKEKFTPEDGVRGYNGVDWADGAFVSARQGLSTNGDTAHGAGKANIENGERIKGNLNHSVDLNIAKDESDKNMDNENPRARGSDYILDVKPLVDKEEGVKDEYKNDSLDAPEENGKNVNRYITSYTTMGGTTIVIDNREGQENYYMIHKNYIENLDQNGSRKIYIGRSISEDGQETTRSSDELAVDGDKKIHVLGDFSTYVKGNILTQCDKNVQLDVNDTYGVRIKKGDFDIVLNGNDDKTRDENSERDKGKEHEYGDLNIDIQNGHLEIHVKKNANIHVEDQCNLLVDGDLKATVGKSYHLNVKGDYNEHIQGNKYTTVKGKVENRFQGKHQKTYIDGEEFKEVKGKNDLIIHGVSTENFKSDRKLKMDRNFYTDTGSNVVEKVGSNVDVNIGSNLSEKIGSSMNTKVGASFNHDIGSSCSVKIGSLYGVTVGREYSLSAFSISMKGSSAIGFKAGSNFAVDSSSFKAKVSSFHVSSAGNFNGDLYSNITNLNAYHNHVHGFMWYWSHPGGASSSVTMPAFGVGAPGVGTAVNVSPDAPPAINPQNPPSIIPDSAINDGGGLSVDNLAGNSTIGEESSRESTNKTKVAKRRNENRKAR